MAEYRKLVLEKICRTCEFGNLPTIPFCVECGDSLTSTFPTERFEAMIWPSEPDVSTEVKFVCSDCKAKIGEGILRCPDCDCVLIGGDKEYWQESSCADEGEATIHLL